MKVSPYSKTYYDHFDGDSYTVDRIVELILQLVQPKSVVDVGCGVGNWLAAFQRHGIDAIQGIDGEYVSSQWLKIPQESFLPMNLNEPQPINRRFDIALSLEVAEHLDPENAPAFVKFLTELAPVVVFSAASPFQGGTEHVNEQWPSYWAELFHEHGYLPVDTLRGDIWNDSQIYFYYRQNILVYVEESYLKQHPSLNAAYARTSQVQLDIVHPEMLDQIFVQRAVKLLRQSVENALHKRLQKRT